MFYPKKLTTFLLKSKACALQKHAKSQGYMYLGYLFFFFSWARQRSDLNLFKHSSDVRSHLLKKFMQIWIPCNWVVHFTTETYISQMAGPSRTVHSQGYYIPHSRTEHHIQSFFPRTARAWNILPVTTVTAPSLVAFCHQLTEGRI